MDITAHIPVEVNTYILHLQGPTVNKKRNQRGAGIRQRSEGFFLCLLLDLEEMGYVFPRYFC
jgi:hypothetical protein